MLAVDDLRGKGAVGNSHHEQVFLKWCLWSKLEWFASALNQWFRTVCEPEMANPCNKYCCLRQLKGLYLSWKKFVCCHWKVRYVGFQCR